MRNPSTRQHANNSESRPDGELSPAIRQALQTALQARRATLEQQRSAHLAGHSRAEHAREVLLQDSDDATQHEAERALDFALTDRDAVALAEIHQALLRLTGGANSPYGAYGRCAGCGGDIPLARLQLAPQATRCVACEGRLERGRPRPPSL